jgi:hypothetical protein
MIDENGKRVGKYNIDNGQSTYFLPFLNYAKGMYQLVILKHDKIYYKVFLYFFITSKTSSILSKIRKVIIEYLFQKSNVPF